jgi:small subunit ribosomal protein S17
VSDEKTKKENQSAAKLAPTEIAKTNPMSKRRQLVGVVVGTKMDKTALVQVDRRFRHKTYKKFVVRSQNYKAHDEKNAAQVGDVVSLTESKPLSKTKRWVVSGTIRKAKAVEMGEAKS